MFDIFEQPYTLIGASVLVLFGIFTFRSVFPEKRRQWQLAVPFVLAGLALALDVLVPTDLEKIDSVIDEGIRAVRQEDCNAMGRILSDSYSDSYHDTKEELLARCRNVLTPGLIEKHTKRGMSPPQINGSRATTTVFTILTFDKSSYISQNYKSFLFTKSRLTLQKQPDGQWLISRIEILELDQQPANWGQIR